jgi:hypothetical protein
VDALAAYAFLLQHDSEQTSPACIQPKTSAASISDVQQRLCKALHAAAAAHTVLLPPSMCFLAPPALLVTDAAYTSQWSSFFRTHMPAQMRSNNFVPGCYPGFMAAPVAFCASWLDALDIPPHPSLNLKCAGFPAFSKTAVAVHSVLPPELLQPLQQWLVFTTPRLQTLSRLIHVSSGTTDASAPARLAGMHCTCNGHQHRLYPWHPLISLLLLLPRLSRLHAAQVCREHQALGI